MREHGNLISRFSISMHNSRGDRVLAREGGGYALHCVSVRKEKTTPSISCIDFGDTVQYLDVKCDVPRDKALNICVRGLHCKICAAWMARSQPAA